MKDRRTLGAWTGRRRDLKIKRKKKWVGGAEWVQMWCENSAKLKAEETTNAGETLYSVCSFRCDAKPTPPSPTTPGRRLLLHPILPTCFPSLYPPAVRLLCPVWHTAAHPFPMYEDSSATSVSWKNPSICSELEIEVCSVGNRQDARCPLSPQIHTSRRGPRKWKAHMPSLPNRERNTFWVSPYCRLFLMFFFCILCTHVGFNPMISFMQNISQSLFAEIGAHHFSLSASTRCLSLSIF